MTALRNEVDLPLEELLRRYDMEKGELSSYLTLRLRLFRCKIFSIVKCLQMQMIYFPMFDCILENGP